MTKHITRIISGQFKGRKIRTPGTVKTHPMGSRERNALFNMIGPDLPGALVLDAFAGSGALGLEALSRGARMAVFVEYDHRAIQTIRDNVATLDVAEQTEIYEQPVGKFTSDREFDVVFVDPPYAEYGHQTMWTIVKQVLPVVTRGGILVLSHPPGHLPSWNGFELVTSKQYAGATLSIFRRQEM